MKNSVLISCVVFFMVAGEVFGEGEWTPDNVEIVPENPTSADVVDITFSGNWPDSCIPSSFPIEVTGNDIYFNVISDLNDVCTQVPTPWQQTRSVGPLSPGTYRVYASLDRGPWTLVTEFYVAETNTCVFIPEQSTVVQTGGVAGIHETYSIQGQFQLTVDFDSNTASFDAVDANLSNGVDLDDLFDMTELVGTVVSDTEIDFDTNDPLLGGKVVHLDLTLADNSVLLTGGFCEIWPDGYCYDMNAIARKKYTAGDVSWIPGESSPVDWNIDRTNPTTTDVIHFSGPTAVFGNACEAEQFMDGTPTLTIDPVNKTIELWFQPPAPEVCPQVYDPVCGLEGSFGPLEAGQWIFFSDDPNTTFSIPFQVSGPTVYYVDADANGADDGSSWADAYTSLPQALGVASNGDEIRVAQGIYRPNDGVVHIPEVNERDLTFQLKNGVTVKGGYAGYGETDPNERDIKLYETILSGDLFGNDGELSSDPCEVLNDPCRAENSYHVVTGSGTNQTAVFEGFTITGGYANGSDPNRAGGGMYNYEGSPTVINCIFIENFAFFGGGMYNSDNSNSLILVNCIFAGNSGSGGGMFITGADANVSNCIFTGNSGGGISAGDCEVTVTNCTITANSAFKGGGIFCGEGSSLTVSNSILWYNTAVYGEQIYGFGGTAVITYSNVEGGSAGVGNIDADPVFVDADDDDYHLNPGSPCIDAGDPSYSGEPNETDLEGNPRVVNGRVDMGAYEFIGGIIYVDDDAPDDPGPGDPGVSDYFENGTKAHPFDMIQEGIDEANDAFEISVLVNPGVYSEAIDFDGKAITVKSTNEPAVLRAPGSYAVSFNNGEDANSVFANFIVKDSDVAFFALFASPTIRNVTVVDNQNGVLADNAEPDISNSIFWNNTNGDLFQCQTKYSCIETGSDGVGNISEDPLFADPADGDYHLKSEGWRWSKYLVHDSHWTYNYVSSRCIDAGNPGSPLGDELLTIPDDPNNDWGVNLRINMGAYGGTAQASMPPHGWALLGDLNNDGTIDFLDLAGQRQDWLKDGSEQPGDLNRDGVVNMLDFTKLAADWLQTTY